ncbi:MAG: hypothetical protein FWG77_06410 [Treponema sp.]|nr:hypothetical protein [Treponema sp.]
MKSTILIIILSITLLSACSRPAPPPPPPALPNTAVQPPQRTVQSSPDPVVTNFDIPAGMIGQIVEIDMRGTLVQVQVIANPELTRWQASFSFMGDHNAAGSFDPNMTMTVLQASSDIGERVMTLVQPELSNNWVTSQSSVAGASALAGMLSQTVTIDLRGSAIPVQVSANAELTEWNVRANLMGNDFTASGTFGAGKVMNITQTNDSGRAGMIIGLVADGLIDDWD